MKNFGINLINLVKTTIKTSLLVVITAGISLGQVQAQAPQTLNIPRTPDIIRNTLNTIPTVDLGLTQQQLEIIRVFLTNYVNQIPNLNLSADQINAVLSYFDVNPAALRIGLNAQQLQALQSFFINNYDRIANLNLSTQDLNTVIAIITNNTQNIETLITVNPEIASLIRSLAPQINQLANTNQQINTIVTLLRTTIPQINNLLTIV
ncbi:MAG: hypothetical protein ACD_20C00346G0002 [uncultured bacterium]|nr:MAG: hypothetical protein ACD_20C00346G0002 [uncultured bacterium]HBH18451.1 hypothetical protein [Cyanobacteria bacterium UBA9579]